MSPMQPRNPIAGPPAAVLYLTELERQQWLLM